MGACASKFKGFKGLKEASDAPPPLDEEAFRELSVAEDIIKKDDAPAEDSEVKHQSLGHLFKEGEAEKGTVDSNGKAFEEVKQDDVKTQENGNEESPKPVADTPLKDETKKPTATTDDVKPETSDEKKGEHEQPLSENVEAGVADKICFVDKKPEIPDAEKMNTEENLAELTKFETSETEKLEGQKPVPEAEEKKKEEEQTDASTIEASEEVKDKLAVEILEREKPVEKKPEEKSVTDMKPDAAEPKEQNQALDARGTKAGEEKKENC